MGTLYGAMCQYEIYSLWQKHVYHFWQQECRIDLDNILLAAWVWSLATAKKQPKESLQIAKRSSSLLGHGGGVHSDVSGCRWCLSQVPVCLVTM